MSIDSFESFPCLLLHEVGIQFLGWKGACRVAMTSKNLWEHFQTVRQTLVQQGVPISKTSVAPVVDMNHIYIVSFVSRLRSLTEQMKKRGKIDDDLKAEMKLLDMIAETMPEPARLAIQEFLPSLSMNDIVTSPPSMHVITGFDIKQ